MPFRTATEDEVVMTTALITVAWLAVAMILVIANTDYRVTLK